MTLTAKHAAFVREYMKDYNGSQAAIRAGYPKSRARKTASEILARPEVKAEVQRRATTINNQVTERTAIDKAWVISKLVENYERAIGAKPVIDEGGNPIGSAPVHNLSAANKALELIGRALGIFVDRQEATKSSAYSHLSDEELERVIVEQTQELDRMIVEHARELGFVRPEKPETPH